MEVYLSRKEQKGPSQTEGDVREMGWEEGFSVIPKRVIIFLPNFRLQDCVPPSCLWRECGDLFRSLLNFTPHIRRETFLDDIC